MRSRCDSNQVLHSTRKKVGNAIQNIPRLLLKTFLPNACIWSVQVNKPRFVTFLDHSMHIKIIIWLCTFGRTGLALAMARISAKWETGRDHPLTVPIRVCEPVTLKASMSFMAHLALIIFYHSTCCVCDHTARHGTRAGHVLRFKARITFLLCT